MSKDHYEENDERMNVIGQNGNDGLHYTEADKKQVCRYDWKHERGDWVVEIAKDIDGHLNLYITNVKSDNMYEIDGDQHGEELHYRITTTEIEEAYRAERV